jgi:DNA-binding NarL/FixJ family response regulator
VTSVVVADDQELVRTGLAMLLQARGIDVLAEASNGQEAVEATARFRPDVVIMDVRMPLMDGIEATRQIRYTGGGSKVLVLTTYDLDSYVYEALRAGAAGFLLKSTPPDRLADGVRVVASGEALLAPSLTRRLIERYVHGPAPTDDTPVALKGLTDRELDVFRAVARGLTNAEIASVLFVSEATVKTHLNRVIAKLGGLSRPQLVVLAYECGFARPGAG